MILKTADSQAQSDRESLCVFQALKTVWQKTPGDFQFLLAGWVRSMQDLDWKWFPHRE